MLVPVQDAVIQWFQRTGRHLPWRGENVSPWGVLVSEFMLQQTPASRVREPFDRWMTRWPSPANLAAASPAEAVRQWGNLGYPRRALRLHRAAQAIVREHGGIVPADVDALLALPGVGPYTARAVAVFAYGAHEPVVDTNVRRVIARWRHGASDQGLASPTRDLADMRALLPEPASSPEFNAALMELGALICTARNPRCVDCPLLSTCSWAASGWPETGARGAAKQKAYRGSDREARGAILKVLRETTGPLSGSRLVAAWPDAVQRERALTGLIADGLVERSPRGRFSLPG